MFQDRMQQFECDKCHSIIPKSKPVRFARVEGKDCHFCSSECYVEYRDAAEEDRLWRDACEHIACAGYD